MPYKWLWIAAIAFTATVLLLVAVAGNTAHPNEEDTPIETPEQVYRIVGTFNGRVAVFVPDAAEPEIVYDTAIATLPETEQQRLHEGIAVSDRKALAQTLEDYLS